jgi:hypothetical protein
LGKIKVTKIEAAEAQLKCAIRLFFARVDPISIGTLVGAASGVLRALGKRHGVQAILHDSDLIIPAYKGKWIEALHTQQNFFKHADRDIDEVLEFDPKSFEMLLVESCHLYRHLASARHLNHGQCYECLVFELWFSHAHPELLKDQSEWDATTGLQFKGVDPNDFEFFLKSIEATDSLPMKPGASGRRYRTGK